jgi:hypothetical protein
MLVRVLRCRWLSPDTSIPLSAVNNHRAAWRAAKPSCGQCFYVARAAASRETLYSGPAVWMRGYKNESRSVEGQMRNESTGFDVPRD